MHGSRWRGLETERGTGSWSLGWHNRPGNRRNKGPRPYRPAKQPRQFIEMWENRRCSILFHFEVPGGR